MSNFKTLKTKGKNNKQERKKKGRGGRNLAATHFEADKNEYSGFLVLDFGRLSALHAGIEGKRGDESVKAASQLWLSCLANDWPA